MDRNYVGFFEALVRYETDLWNALDAFLRADHGLTLAHLEALRVVNRRNGACRVQDVANDLSITVGAASKLVDRLENTRLATRRSHPDDRRSSLINLTARGRTMHDNGIQSLERHLQAYLSASFAPEEITMITKRLIAARGHVRAFRREASE